MRNPETPLRIGVYVCHCGTNIAGFLDVEELAAFARTLPGVVLARDYKYMCSDPGQELIKQDIQEYRLNRIVVAACSPNLHEPTFRNAAEAAGMNRFLVQMANIREQVSWVATDRQEGMIKARAHIAAAVRRVALHEPLERQYVRITPRVLVVGGGIAGIQAALNIADAGREVILVERQPSIGGHMAMFDKTFPTLDCAACILTPKMTAIKTHPNIKLLTYSDVVSVDGSVGRYTVRIRRRPRYIDEQACVGCMQCIEGCVFTRPKFPNEFDQGLGYRKPVYIPFAQAVPPVPVIDPKVCLYLSRGKCTQTCVKACGERNAIRFDQTETYEEYEVGAIIVATGFRAFDPTPIRYYGYSTYPNVYTALEIERLINAGGPTAGQLVLPDGRTPKRVGIIHCVGSRDKKYHPYCSRVCCMYALKLAHLVKEHTGAEVYNFYIDIRAPGKAFEEFYQRVENEGVRFIRGKVADIRPVSQAGVSAHSPSSGNGDGNTPPDPSATAQAVQLSPSAPAYQAQPAKKESATPIEPLLVRVEDTLLGEVREIPLDMVILAIALEPQPDADEVRRLFGISCSTEGFFLEKHPKLAPVQTANDGVFLAGACQGPKDIPDTVAQASAAAAAALALIDAGQIELEPNIAWIDETMCSGCRTCILLCPYKAIHTDLERNVAVVDPALCKGCGTCVAACPSGAAKQYLFSYEQIDQELEGILNYV
ncbi:MAG: CoB--CoM heterodisulfide reductase iron-sulfur subunit A family protein [Thermoguttaceae bacterium]|nr:CoB--CoM heterodisulfide reductase iron-sulfur subunit A family protein [Thermoguttaceae bacterium]MDW8039513.1 CoB--CoM heterodisulfide reductase iron-sulfur subunit A family protein [Thermoguttaceae bacterium]